MKLRLALAAATCLALPLAAHAQPVTGPYVSLGAGTSILDSNNYKFENLGKSGSLNWRSAFAGDFAGGYGFGNGFRVQLDLAFARNTLHKANDDFYGETRLSGGENKYGPMVNVIYDIPVGWPVIPYVGAGAGYQWVKYNSDVGGFIGGTKGSFAYDVIAGLSYPLPMVPGLAATAEYRFMQLTENRAYTYNTGLAASASRLARNSATPSCSACATRSSTRRRPWPRRPPRSLRWLPRLRPRPAPSWCSSTGTRLT